MSSSQSLVGLQRQRQVAAPLALCKFGSPSAFAKEFGRANIWAVASWALVGQAELKTCRSCQTYPGWKGPEQSILPIIFVHMHILSVRERCSHQTVRQIPFSCWGVWPIASVMSCFTMKSEAIFCKISRMRTLAATVIRFFVESNEYERLSFFENKLIKNVF